MVPRAQRDRESREEKQNNMPDEFKPCTILYLPDYSDESPKDVSNVDVTVNFPQARRCHFHEERL